AQAPTSTRPSRAFSWPAYATSAKPSEPRSRARAYLPEPGPVAQWIERQTSNLRAEVRLLPGPLGSWRRRNRQKHSLSARCDPASKPSVPVAARVNPHGCEHPRARVLGLWGRCRPWWYLGSATLLDPRRSPAYVRNYRGSLTSRDALLSLPRGSDAVISRCSVRTLFGTRTRIAADALPDCVSPSLDARKARLPLTVIR
ncbi:MAG: hypothetical protein K0S82_1260, partial [Gaiellaceae bacterium]|nr:hypothetical protein [Gaiellaceae bacterium]